eukprot:scaffold115701_cov75-Phaeocystis_antarctica.AAC.4
MSLSVSASGVPPRRRYSIYVFTRRRAANAATHTNGTAYPRGTYASVHTQTHSAARQSMVRAHAGPLSLAHAETRGARALLR